MLYEFGGFIWEFLDGSSLDEEIISIENETIIQITPSGNLGRGKKHAITDVPAGGSRALPITVPSYGGNSIQFVYGSTLWLGDISDLTFKLRTPLGKTRVLEADEPQKEIARRAAFLCERRQTGQQFHIELAERPHAVARAGCHHLPLVL